MTEIQTITVSSDEYFIYEEQTVTVSGSSDMTFTLYLGDEDDKSGELKVTSNAMDIERALENTLSITDVEVTQFDSKNGTVFTVRFLDPVGDVPDLVANVTEGSVNVDEVLKGYSPLDGTLLWHTRVNIQWMWTDASAAEMKVALEAINTIDEVDVQRENLGFGLSVDGDIPELWGICAIWCR